MQHQPLDRSLGARGKSRDVIGFHRISLSFRWRFHEHGGFRAMLGRHKVETGGGGWRDDLEAGPEPRDQELRLQHRAARQLSTASFAADPSCLDTGSSYFHSILVHRAPLRGCIRRTAGRPRRRATAARSSGRPAERLSHVSRPAPKARGRVRGPIPCGEEGAGWQKLRDAIKRSSKPRL